MKKTLLSLLAILMLGLTPSMAQFEEENDPHPHGQEELVEDTNAEDEVDPITFEQLRGNQFMIYLAEEAGSIEVAVIDMLGNPVHLIRTPSTTEYLLDLSAQKHGVYFIKVTQGKHLITKKVIVR